MAVLALVLALVGGVHKRHVEITSLDFDWTSAHDWELAQQLITSRAPGGGWAGVAVAAVLQGFQP